MHDVTIGQLALLFTAVALFAAAEAASLARIWWDREGCAVAAKVSLYLGTLCGLGVSVWHAVHRGSWLPLEDNFDALVWLGAAAGAFVLYTQRAHPLAWDSTGSSCRSSSCC